MRACASVRPSKIHQTLLGMSEGYGVRLQKQFAEETARASIQRDDRTFAKLHAELDDSDDVPRGQ